MYSCQVFLLEIDVKKWVEDLSEILSILSVLFEIDWLERHLEGAAVLHKQIKIEVGFDPFCQFDETAHKLHLLELFCKDLSLVGLRVSPESIKILVNPLEVYLRLLFAPYVVHFDAIHLFKELFQLQMKWAQNLVSFIPVIFVDVYPDLAIHLKNYQR